MKKRLDFDSQGKLVGVDQKAVPKHAYTKKKKWGRRKNYTNESDENEKYSGDLRTSDSLGFLKSEKMEGIFDRKHWSLFENDTELPPLVFSNGKSQEDVVKELVDLVESGKKVIFLHGVCGTGKSAIALNVARSLGRASVVVPVKALQRQYEEEYMSKKYVVKTNGHKMKIAMITGRDNHDSIIEPGKSCADPFLPDTIKFTEKNYDKLKKYYLENPFISNKAMPILKSMKRIAIAPSNPYWSPIMPEEVELNSLKDATKIKYEGMNGRHYVFYHRKRGCSYYDQYLAYKDADIIIFNSAKYLTEISMGRKPRTDVEIIDEADEFLDSFSNNVELNLTRLTTTLKMLVPDSEKAQYSIDKILGFIELEEKNKRALGIDEDRVYEIAETKLGDILARVIEDNELQAEIAIDEANYSNLLLEASRKFKDSIKDTYLTFRKEEENLFARLVTTNLSQKFQEIVDGNRAIILMSGTLHSDKVLEHIFGIKDFAVVEAETLQQGAIEILRTGKEFDCRYSNFKSEKHTRKDYLEALKLIVDKSEKPALIHVNAFSDLPSYEEFSEYNFDSGMMAREKLRELQWEDKTGKMVSMFRSKMSDRLFTTKCSRGIDFPGDSCKSVVFTKYPNPNVKDTFWKILQKTHSEYYWEFYFDKARREFLQRIYRAVRSKDDHVYVMSPDMRVLDAVRDLQKNGH